MNFLWQWLLGLSGADFAGADGWSLRLTGMPASASVLLALLALFALLGWWTVRCYLREGATSRGVKLAIAASRLAVLALAFWVLLQPALMVRFSNVRRGAVVVLVDDTLSMQWRDRYSDSQQAALAAALGLPAGRLAGEDRPTRAEAVRLALSRQGGALSKLAADHPLVVYRFGVTGAEDKSYVERLADTDTAAAAEASDFAETVRQRLDSLKADGRYTDLGRAVREMLNALEGRRLAAVVIVSDGRGTGVERARLAGAAQMAGQRGVPLFSVAVGDPVPPRNVAITQLLAPREARAGSKIALTALVTHRSMPRTTTEVQLWRSRSGQEDWEDTQVRAEVTIGGDPEPGTPPASGAAAGLQEVALVTDAPAVGAYTYQARIIPPREDSIASDNQASAVVRVTDQKVKVLLVAGGASWEFQHVRDFLLKSAEHYAVTVWQQNADPRFNQDASLGMKRTALPASRQELADYDVVVLCDPRHVPGSFDERFLELLDQFVGKQQGGLCYLAGNKSSARTLGGHGALEPLGALLPVVLAPEEAAGPRGDERQTWRVELTSEGQAHPALRLGTAGADSAATWRRMPGVYRTQRVAKLKPAAVALAVREDTSRGRQDQVDPLAAVQYYGRGRVLYLGFDGTWRWRAIDDAARYEQLWSNIMEFLAAGRLEKSRILVTTAGDAFDAGSDIDVRIEASNRDFNPLEAKALVLEMRGRDGGEPVRQTISRQRPGLYAGTIRAERMGTFELTVKSDETGMADWSAEEVSTRMIEVRLPQAEFRKPEADFDALGELAGVESRFLRLDEIETLPGRIPASEVRVTSESPHPLWSTRLTLLLFGLLLLTEWTSRKVYKMM